MESKNKRDSIKGITQDSRQVRPGWLFAALSGSRQDGHAYIIDAIRHGATHLLVRRGVVVPPEAAGLVVVESDNPHHDLSVMAAEFYARQPDNIVAVTGTNGKTSTVHFTQQLWQSQNIHSASLGTLGVRGDGVVKTGSMTTPDQVSLHAGLADLAAAGITHLAMEASSHGLKQHRLDGVNLSAAGFTNLTRDHLDYHPDMKDYLNAKARLFSDVLRPGGVAVLNADVPEFDVLSAITMQRGIAVRSYGTAGKDFRLIAREALPGGQRVMLEVLGRKHDLIIPLVGAFMVMNALCALGLAMAGNDDQAYVDTLRNIGGAPGRLQLVPGHPKGAAVYVDYAHTPDALDNILRALRPHTTGRLICLFGCGGDRDPGKRPMMGKIASDLADMVVVTDDNPRGEDAAKIRAAIVASSPGAKNIDGRCAAIAYAIDELQNGDVLVLAGKGHEQGQIFADHVDPFDDVDEAEKAIRAFKER